MTPELREHIAAFTADCAADGLGYLGKHRQDHGATSVVEVVSRLDRVTLAVLWRSRNVPTRHYQPCPKCKDTGLARRHYGDSTGSFSYGAQWYGNCPLGCPLVPGSTVDLALLPTLPVVASPPRPSTGEGKGRPIEFGSVDRPTTQTGPLAEVDGLKRDAPDRADALGRTGRDEPSAPTSPPPLPPVFTRPTTQT